MVSRFRQAFTLFQPSSRSVTALKAFSNGTTATYVVKPFYINPLFQHAVWRQVLSTKLYHGTTLDQVSQQLQAGTFDNLDKRVYFGDEQTAVTYASKKALLSNCTPVILQIDSDQTAQYNKIEMEGWGSGDLGHYPFFLTSRARVEILNASIIVEDKKNLFKNN